MATEAGLAGTLTEAAPGALTRMYYKHRAILGAAPALAVAASPSFMGKVVSVDGFDAVQAAAAEGRGLVIAGTHFGSLGITPALLVRKGYRVLVLRDQQFERLLNTRYAKQFFLGAEPLFLDMNNPESVNKALLRCARALREGAIIAYTVDGRHGSRFQEGKLFGHQVQVRTALVELAMRSNSPVLYAFSFVDAGRIRVQMAAPVRLKSEDELAKWCWDFCSCWEHLLLNHPQSTSWHRTDLELLAASEKGF